MELLLDSVYQASMGHILIKILLNAVAVFLGAYFLKGVEVADFTRALIIALLLSVLNATAGALLKFFAFPFRLLTLGLFSFVIDALMILIAAYFLKGFKVKGFLDALLLAIIISIFNALLYAVFL